MGADRLTDVLEALLAEIKKLGRDATLNVFEDRTRDADAAWLRDPLKARRDVHAIAENVLAIDQNIAEIDPDPIEDALRLGELGVRSAIIFWIATARSTAATTEGNSSSTPSPVVLTSRPPDPRTIGVAVS